MPRFKKVIVRVSVFLLLFLLLATVLSKTIYRLLLPQVRQVSVGLINSLDNALAFHAVVGSLAGETGGESAQNGEAPAEATQENPKYAVDVRMSFKEMQMLYLQSSSITATADLVYEPVGIPVAIWISDHEYDSSTDNYIVHFFVRSQGKPIETGAPLTITMIPKSYSMPYFVPLNSIYTELVGGAPQYYVYAIENRTTMWGRESYLQKRSVTLGGSDYKEAQVTFAGVPPKFVACYPSRPLSDGDVVKISAEA